MLVHGWCCDAVTMQPLAEHLRPSHRVLNLELRGHGASGGSTPDMRVLVEDVAAVCSLAGGPVVLIGHSLGGRVALATAQGRPDLVRALVMLDSAIEEEPAYVARRRAEVEATAPEALRQRFEGLFGAPSPAAHAIVDRMLQVPPGVALDTLAASDAFDAGTALREYAGPALYIAASRPRAERSRLQEIRPALMYGQVVGAGHFVQIEAAPQVTAMIDRFLELAIGP